MPEPVGEPGGGMANAIVGTLILIGLGSLFAIPIGVISGIYMAEYSGTRLATVVRFAADTLNGVPSIVIGVFVYGIAVLPFKQFSALAGGLALGVMMIPIIARTTEELLLLVPGRCAKARWRSAPHAAGAVFTVVLPAALPGIITGIVLALARIAGETAPLLFTAFNNRFFSTRLDQPISSLTVQVFTYAISPYEDWHRRHGQARSCWSRWSSSARCSRGIATRRLRAPANRTLDGMSPNATKIATPTHGLVNDRPKNGGPPIESLPTAIEVEKMSFYYGQTQALYDISVKLRANLVTAFIGPSGCGKSTFLRTLNRMNDIIPGARVTGKVMIDGKDIYAI